MARRIAAEQIGWPTYEDAAAHNHHTDKYVSVALTAIIETQRLDAELAWKYAVGDAIRAGKHYGKDTDQ